MLATAACGDDGAPIGEGSGTSASTGPAVTGDTTEGPGMTGPSVTGDGTDTASTTAEVTTAEVTTDDDTSGGACTSPPEGEACQPAGTTTIEWRVRIDGRELQEEVTGSCTVTDVTDDGTTTIVFLDCTRFLAEVELVTTNPHHVPDLQPDDPVELHWSAGFEDEANLARYLTLRRGGLALGAFDASEFAPPPGFDYEPVVLEVLGTDCERVATECVYKQDAALQASFDGDVALLFGGQDAFVGQLTSYRVMTGLVEHMECFPNGCGYSYAEWLVQGLVFRVPEG